MSAMTINIHSNSTGQKKISIELDADKFERLAAGLGFFNPAFLASIDRAEKDYRAGRTREVSTLRELRIGSVRRQLKSNAHSPHKRV